MGSSLLRDIQKGLDRRTRRRRQAAAHFDSGMAIDLRYDDAFYPTGPPQFSTASSSDPLGAAFDGLPPSARAVPFEDESEENYAAWGTGELEEMEESEQPSRFVAARTLTAGEQQGEAPVWGTGELEELEQAAAQSMSGPGAAEEIPVWGTGELKQLEAPAAEAASPRFRPAPARVEMKPGSLLDAAAQSDDQETHAFVNDIASILSGRKEHPSTAAPAELPPSTEPEPSSASPSDLRPNPTGFTHDVFEAMGKNLSMAQTFDAGTFSLSRELDAFDRELDRQERARPNAAAHELPEISPAELAADLSALRLEVQPAASAPAIAASALDLRFDVPLVPQQTGMSCWAAGCSMLVGWKRQMSIDPAEIARAAGAWAQYRDGLAPEDTSIFPVWDMAPEPPQSYTVEGFHRLLDTYGPLWVASAEPGPHIRVVTGIRGDGTPAGTILSINDPWEVGMTVFRSPNAGAQYTETYEQFVRKQETLARRESSIPGAIYVAHLREPRSL